jgi:hypothetical protein
MSNAGQHPPFPLCMSVERKHFGWKNIKTALPTRRRPLRVTLYSLGAKRDLKADRKRPVAVRRSTLGDWTVLVRGEGQYNPACKWLEFHYPVAIRTFLNVTKLFIQDKMKPSFIINIIYSSHLISHPNSSFHPCRGIW